MGIGAIIVGIIICFGVYFGSSKESTSHLVVGCGLLLLILVLAVALITSISY